LPVAANTELRTVDPNEKLQRKEETMRRDIDGLAALVERASSRSSGARAAAL
jgi:hypothetical protein